jgi:cysteine desulfurase/selenocysteine lyase
MLGPTGLGILYGKEQLLESMPPYQGGGDMIKTVTFEKTTYNDLPFRFEAGTPNIEGGIAFAEAIEYMNELDRTSLEAWEAELLEYTTSSLKSIDGIRLVGEAANKVPLVSFTMVGLHPYDVGFILDKHGIALRTGHHCAQPVMDFFGIPGTLRASLAFYNTKEEVDRMIGGLLVAKKMLS